MMLWSCDVVVVGGSNAGLSAALTLGRARRKVLVIDREEPRNASARRAQNFFTRDGTPPAELRRIGRAQLQPYEVSFRIGEVEKAQRKGDMFAVTLSDGSLMSARKLLLATGVVDDLPALPNLSAVWGKHVFTCPYCHGWEVKDTPLAVIGRGDMGYEYALLIYNWSHDLTLCSDGPAQLNEVQQSYLKALGVDIVETPLAGFDLDQANKLQAITFVDGKRLTRHAAFMRPPARLRANLAMQLGCELSDDSTRIVVDDFGQTTVPGVYAAGDAVTPFHQVIGAASDGSKAAAMLNHAFIQETHRDRHKAVGGQISRDGITSI